MHSLAYAVTYLSQCNQGAFGRVAYFLVSLVGVIEVERCETRRRNAIACERLDGLYARFDFRNRKRADLLFAFGVVWVVDRVAFHMILDELVTQPLVQLRR